MPSKTKHPKNRIYTFSFRFISNKELASGYLASIIKDSEIMRDSNDTERVSIRLSLFYTNREWLNDIYKAINNKVNRLRRPKCEKEPMRMEPLHPPTYVRSYTYVCHDVWDNGMYEAYLTMKCFINDVNKEYVFLMQIDGAKFVVVNLAHEIDMVFTKRIPLSTGPIYWEIGKLPEGDQHGR